MIPNEPTMVGESEKDVNVFLNKGEADEMLVEGYKRSRFKTLAILVPTILTLGFLRLVFHWKPEWGLRATHDRCSLTTASKNNCKQYFVENIQKEEDINEKPWESGISEQGEGSPGVRLFINRKLKYIWQSREQAFEKLRSYAEPASFPTFHQAKGLSSEERKKRLQLFGPNSTTVHVMPIMRILMKEIIGPLYMFQWFSMILWYIDEYYYYATCIVIVTVFSLVVSVYQIRRNQRALKKNANVSGERVQVMNEFEESVAIWSDEVVPGDVIQIERHGGFMQCDAILLSGNAIVNESSLMGESAPVTKTPFPNPSSPTGAKEQHFTLQEHGRHVLFCGTEVIQTRYYGYQSVRALVIRTGFYTTKGELIRSILFPKPVDFQINRGAYKFLGFLAFVAMFGLIYSFTVMISAGQDSTGEIVLRSLDLITIVIPPALPAAMTVGLVFAQNRLKKHKVFCISPNAINLCGTINAFCFDKTGTLTEDGMDLWGIVSSLADSGDNVLKKVNEIRNERLVWALACCHSLTTINGKLAGDTMDMKLFEATGWELEETGEDTTRYNVITPTVVRPKNVNQETQAPPLEIGIVRQLAFSSNLQRMSVVTRNLNESHFDVYTKGAPETIIQLCTPDSVPKDIFKTLARYTEHGYRVLAIAWRPLASMNYAHVQRAPRESLEADLHFLGLVIMENRLKPVTTSIIDELNAANIRNAMITGDNILTALSVARECHMVNPMATILELKVSPPTLNTPASLELLQVSTDWQSGKMLRSEDFIKQFNEMKNVQLAMVGKSWDALSHHFSDLVEMTVFYGRVFARMSPEQKMQLIEALQSIGYNVGMCGDGANDCGALKLAHAGISLSDAEASVASPFTSKTPDISCVPTVIREGRTSLVTSYGIFRFMASYSLIQFATVCMLYWVDLNISDPQFMYIDMLLLTTLSITFGYTQARESLAPSPPEVRLTALRSLVSLVCHMVVCIGLQVLVWQYTRIQPWWIPFEPNPDNVFDYASHETTAIFSVSAFQYIMMSVVLAKGAPHRKPIYTNVYFLVNVIVLVILTVYTVLGSAPGYAEFMQLDQLPSMPYRLLIIGICLMGMFLAFLIEMLFDSDLALEKLVRAHPRKWEQMQNEQNNHTSLNYEASTLPSAPENTGAEEEKILPRKGPRFYHDTETEFIEDHHPGNKEMKGLSIKADMKDTFTDIGKQEDLPHSTAASRFPALSVEGGAVNRGLVLDERNSDSLAITEL